MSYDLYVSIPCEDQNAADGIARGKINDIEIPNIYTRIQLLAPALRIEARWGRVKGKDYAHGMYHRLVFHFPDSAQTTYATELISEERAYMQQLGIWKPAIPDMGTLPPHSLFLQFQFTLAKPYLSRDDEIFYINDNPVRKDKVFKIPMVAGTAWKGNLRWTATYMMVLRWHESHDVNQLAEERFRLTRLFGDEIGEGEGRHLAKYLDGLSQEAASRYRQLVRRYFERTGNDPRPNHAGWLRFYPTFFDRISLEVINPHDRQTRTGKYPIYFESVPIGAKGTFSLLYVPLGPVDENLMRADLQTSAEAIREMMRTYGFSAKKSSGFGEAEDEISGKIVTARDQRILNTLSGLTDEVSHVQL